jgi:hypothetical protein
MLGGWGLRGLVDGKDAPRGNKALLIKVLPRLHHATNEQVRGSQ